MKEPWSIVLAGGSGTRLAALTTVAGETIPKQYCALAAGPSMLRRALWRAAAAAADPSRVLVVVTGAQRRWWEPELRELPAANVLVQPEDRGTAAGLLLPLAEVLRRTTDAVVTIVPADHHVERERELRRALARAAAAAWTGPRPIALVGVTPDELDPDLGWIMPVGAAAEAGARAVAQFHEKPARAQAALLLAAGGMVNTFLFAARARALWALCERLLPEVALPLGAGGASDLAAIYERLPAADFSRRILERSPESLSVVNAGRCGWSDLGTPERVVRCLRRRAAVGRESTPVAAALDLSRQVLRMSFAGLAG